MKPDQVRAYNDLRPGVKAEADMVESAVDNAIEDADRAGSWPAHIHVAGTEIWRALGRRTPQDTIDEVIRRYAAAGWNIRQGGSFLIIEQPGMPARRTVL